VQLCAEEVFLHCLLSTDECTFYGGLYFSISRWRQSTGGCIFSILFLLYVLQVGSLIIWFTDTGQSLSAEVCDSISPTVYFLPLPIYCAISCSISD